jgi:tRNA dimethylallyltransferase
MIKVLVIGGPTAIGKSAFAVDCALRFNGEIINGDSQQVYRELSIGNAKSKGEDQRGINHHLLDVVSYSENYDVATFQRQCRAAIDDIASRGKLPIVCGGTGHYLKAALYDYDFPAERLTFEDPVALTNEAVHAQLALSDPQAAAAIHPNNRKRVLRALAMAATGFTKSDRLANQQGKPLYDLKVIVLDTERSVVAQRIAQRVEKMMVNGLEHEVRTYFSDPKAQSYHSFLGIGYKEFKGYLNGTSTLEDVKNDIIVHTRQYARRQLTWFRHQFDATWIDIQDHSAIERVVAEISAWSKENS